jgi:hypothetical protein
MNQNNYVDYLIIQNSWGDNKGNKGLFFCPKTYLPFEAWVILTDLPTPEPGLIGWVASKYIFNGITTNPLNLRSSAGLGGSVIAVLPKGTSVSRVDPEQVTVDGYTWVNVYVN